jgi:hypothetical protein
MRTLVALGGAILIAAMGCGGDDAGSGGGSTSGSGGSGAGTTTTGGGGTGGSGGSGANGGGGSGAAPPAGVACDPLPEPSGMIIDVTPQDDLVAAVAGAPPGATVLLAAGNYDLTGQSVWLGDGVTLRGQSDDPSAVVLDGGYDTNGGGMVNAASASGVTIADLTIQRPRFHAIHITANDAAANDALIHRVRIFDPGEQAIKINHSSNGNYADDGEIACSTITLTEPGRQQVMSYTSSGSNCYTGGVDAHGARDWLVRDNIITGFWCSNSDLAEHGIHFWTGSRDTTVVRNHLVDNARGIGFGLTVGGRTYADDPCSGVNDASHYGGFVANNFVSATDPNLFASPNGMDLGIGIWHACGATVVHNTVASDQAPFSSIEWRFPETSVELVNNLVSHTLRERDGASATMDGNMEDVTQGYADLASADLHLAAGSPAIAQGSALGAMLSPEDIDGDVRPTGPDVGADQQ